MGRRGTPTERETAAATRVATAAVDSIHLRDVPLPRTRGGDFATSHLNGYSAKAQAPFPGVVGQNATAPSARRSSTPTATKTQPTAVSIAAAPQGSKSVAVDMRPLRRGVGDGGGRRSFVPRVTAPSAVAAPPQRAATAVAMTPTTTGTVDPASRSMRDVTKRSMGPDDFGDVKSALLAGSRSQVSIPVSVGRATRDYSAMDAGVGVSEMDASATHNFVTRHGHGMSNCNYNKR